MWDLRRFVDKSPVAIFKHHTAPVTSVEWHGTDSAVFASSGEDNQIALWDLSVEKDDNDVKEVEVSVNSQIVSAIIYRVTCEWNYTHL